MSSWRFGSLRVWLFLAASLGAGPAHALCGDGVWEDGEQCDDGNTVANDACNECRLSCEKIGDPLTFHTCGHGAFGPFQAEAAQSYPGFVFTDISEPHTYFTLTLSGDPGQNRSGVLYSTGFDGLHAFYLKQPYPLSVLADDEEVPLLFEHEISCGTSDSLTWVKVYELDSANVYTVAFGAIEGSNVSFAVERMGPASPVFWDRDGDEHGGALAGLGSCQYDDPNGFAPVELNDDCDDDDANVHPGAAERCDGIDNDCAGGTDTGDPRVCDEDRAGTACVDRAGVIGCGCAVDADCTSEELCNVGAQRCETARGSGGADSGAAGEGGGGEDASAAGAGGVARGGASGAGGRGNAGETSAVAGAAGDSEGAGRSGTGGTTAGSSGTGGSSGARVTGGAGREPAAAGSGGGSSSDSGCGCRMAGSRASSAGIGLLAFAFLGLLRRRR
jgi:MYXO-CTERM domain-containing protein